MESASFLKLPPFFEVNERGGPGQRGSIYSLAARRREGCCDMQEPRTFLPLVSFGTYKLKGIACRAAVEAALQSGYESIDTATCYNNHREVAAAIESSGIARADIFITSKIAPWEVSSSETAYEAIRQSLNELRTSYIDLMLLHWPGMSKTPVSSPQHRISRASSWKALLRAKAERLVRHIGVSNFEVQHLEQLRTDFGGGEDGVPSVNQVERHPLCPQRELLEYCLAKGIVLQAYSPLGCNDAALVSHPALLTVAAEAGVSPHAALLCFSVQESVPLVVKASSPARIADNLTSIRSARLSPSQLARLHEEMQERKKFCWDPASVA